MGWSVDPPDEADPELTCLEGGCDATGPEGRTDNGTAAYSGRGAASTELTPEVLPKILAKKTAAKARKAARLEALAKAAWSPMLSVILDTGGGLDGSPGTAPGGEANPP